MMQKIQRFGSAMIVPVMLFPFFGIVVGFATLFQNPDIMGSLAAEGTLWKSIWHLIETGGWAVFNQMELVFLIGLPISLAKKAQAKAVLEAFMGYIMYNYFINGILSTWGSNFGVDFGVDSGGTSGLKSIAGIKTLDTGIIGAIVIAAIIVWLHNRYFDKQIPEFLGTFQGTPIVVAISFVLMIPCAFITAGLWPIVQRGILSMQYFIKATGLVGVWIFHFLERILIPTGLHHFVYTPFQYGPAVISEGITPYWISHLSEFAQSAAPLKELFPQARFTLHGNVKMFGIPGLAYAMYCTAKPEKRKKVGALLLAATLTSVVSGITEPIEFTFLFIAPYLFAIHAILAATMSTVMNAFGLVGNMGGGLIEVATSNWIPLFSNHWQTYVMQFIVGFGFMAIYYFVFRHLILRFDIPLPGREKSDTETKLYTKQEYREKKGTVEGAAQEADQKARAYLEGLGGRDNIVDITNCFSRLRINVADEARVKPASFFKNAGALGLVHKGKSVQVIVGTSVSLVREKFEELLEEETSRQ